MFTRLITGLVIAVAGLSPLACSTPPDSTEEKSTFSTDTEAALQRFKAADDTLQGELDKSAGYIVFPELGKAGVIVGATYGRGEVFEKGVMIGYAELTQGTVGLQLGAQVFSELIIFKTQAALDDFKDGEFSFAANATAVAVKPGAAATTSYSDGVAVFVHIKGGLMAEAAIGGQKLNYKPK